MPGRPKNSYISEFEWSRSLVRDDRSFTQFPKDEHFAQDRMNDPHKGRNNRRSEKIGLHATSSAA